MMELTTAGWVAHLLRHPLEGYEDMRWKKAGSLKLSWALLILLFFSTIAEHRMYGFQFGVTSVSDFNVIPYFVATIGAFLLWAISSRAISTWLDGEGSLRTVFVYSAYALIPYLGQSILKLGLSHLLIREEEVFLNVIAAVGIGWSALLLFMAVKTAHQYRTLKTLWSIFLTLLSMLVMLFLLILILFLFQQIYQFVCAVFAEILYRIQV